MKKDYDHDEGGCGDFYLNWRTPNLRLLVASNYVPHPYIGRTITKLQLRSDDLVNEKYLLETLHSATSINELHIFFFVYSTSSRVGFYRDPDAITDSRPVELPQIRTLTVTLEINHDKFHPLNKVFRFPNIEIFTVVLVRARETSVIAQTLVRQMGIAISGPVDTVRLIHEDKDDSRTLRESLSRTLYSYECRRLEIVGNCWDMEMPDLELDEGTAFFRILEEVDLVQCDEKIVQLVRDLWTVTRLAKVKVVRAIDCAPSLEEILVSEVPSEILEVTRSAIFGEHSSHAVSRVGMSMLTPREHYNDHQFYQNKEFRRDFTMPLNCWKICFSLHRAQEILYRSN